MAVAGQLFRLEQLDGELEQLKARLTQVERQQKRNPELEAATAQLERLQAEREKAAAAQRSLESDLGVLESRVKRDHNRIYGGQVVDPREIASLEKELEHYRAQQSALEDRVLEGMEQLETLESEVQTLTARIEGLRSRWETDRPGLAAEVGEIGEAIARLQTQREQLSAELDQRSLGIYDRLRSGSGHAVSSVSNGTCQWCRVTLPAKDVQHARSGTLVTCTNCARILYVGS